MAIETRSAFIYGHTIDDDNSFINFTEDGIIELSATIEVGSYTITQFTDAIAKALNEVGDNNYTATLDRITRKISVSSDASFSFLVTTGSNISISAFPLMGFTTDQTGLLTYEADEESGTYYTPQATLRRYKDSEDNQSSVQSKVNESSEGDIELVTYGTRTFTSFNIKYITDITGQSGNVAEDDPNGRLNANLFMRYIRLKRPIEFMPDRDTPSDFKSMFLEKTSQGADGTKYELQELYAEKLAFYFQTGTLLFRIL
tara:strand:- start:9999 stop:10772 length:774 start_codon:yes stop_codon:yes gene_type:complete